MDITKSQPNYIAYFYALNLTLIYFFLFACYSSKSTTIEAKSRRCVTWNLVLVTWYGHFSAKAEPSGAFMNDKLDIHLKYTIELHEVEFI